MEQFSDRLVDLTVRPGEFTNRPIRPEHQAVWPEQVQGEVNVRSELVDGPGSMVGFGDHPRNLAKDVGKAGCFAKQAGPAFDLTGFDQGFGQVVDHHRQVG